MQGFHRFFDWRLRVEPVDLVEVDVVRAESAQGGVDLLHDGLARKSLPTRSIVHAEMQLGRQDDLIALGERIQRRTNDFLRTSQLVDIGGVPEVNAEIQRLTEEGQRLFLAPATRC